MNILIIKLFVKLKSPECWKLFKDLKNVQHESTSVLYTNNNFSYSKQKM